MTLPPDSFYYVLSFLFGSGLIWIARTHIVRTDAILKQMSETIADLKTIVAVHENKHIEADRRIDEVREKRNSE